MHARTGGAVAVGGPGVDERLLLLVRAQQRAALINTPNPRLRLRVHRLRGHRMPVP